MAALDLFIRPSMHDSHPMQRDVLLALNAAERARRLGELQSEIRTRLAAAPDLRDWRNQVGMIVADLRRGGHELRRDGDSHTWLGETGHLDVSFCQAGNTVLDWPA